MKYHLRRVVGDTKLTYEQLATILAQIEAILNSRPLCALTDDPEDLDVLTPGHFLIGHQLCLIPKPNLELNKTSKLLHWQHITQMVHSFWSKWSKEYLQTHHAVYKWNRTVESIKKGDLVLVHDERLPPAKWPIGRVLDVHPGTDNLVRVATVKTCSSTYTRPIVKLCPLHISSMVENSPLRPTKAGGNVWVSHKFLHRSVRIQRWINEKIHSIFIAPRHLCVTNTHLDDLSTIYSIIITLRLMTFFLRLALFHSVYCGVGSLVNWSLIEKDAHKVKPPHLLLLCRDAILLSSKNHRSYILCCEAKLSSSPSLQFDTVLWRQVEFITKPSIL